MRRQPPELLESMRFPVSLDQKHSIFMNPFVEYIRAAVDVVVENFTYESVFRLLRCGMTDISTEEMDRLENYVIAMGIQGLGKWQSQWVRTYRGQVPEECVLLNETRTRLVDMWKPFYEKMKAPGAKVRDYAQALYEYICENHIEEQLKAYEQRFGEEQNQAMVKEYSQIYRIVMDLLDKLVEILGEQQVRPREFKEILDAGLTEAKVGIIPPTSDQVLVGDMERTRLKEIKVLFFVGVNEGKIPKEQQAGKLLSDLNREELKRPLEDLGLSLAPTAKEALYTQKFYLYLNLTKPSEKVFLSYSRMDGSGQAMSPSFLISQVERLFPEVKENGEIPLFLESPYSALDKLSEQLRSVQKESPLFEELLSWFQSQETLDAVQQLTGKLPLVLHGGTGIPDDMIKKAISLGVAKINVNTECQLSFAEATRKYIEAGKDLEGKGYDPRKLLKPGADAIIETVKEKMELFGSVGKAE